jgi:hypothetical protein
MDVAADKAEADFLRGRGFGLELGFGERPALLVIDLMKAFTDASLPLGANLDVQVAATNRLLEVAHASGFTFRMLPTTNPTAPTPACGARR